MPKESIIIQLNDDSDFCFVVNATISEEREEVQTPIPSTACHYSQKLCKTVESIENVEMEVFGVSIDITENVKSLPKEVIEKIENKIIEYSYK